MLKNVRLHIELDEVKQLELESKLANRIASTHKKNLAAFKRFIPSMLPFVQQISLDSISPFSNKDGDINLINYATGRTFYGRNPSVEIESQVKYFLSRSPYVSLNADNEAEHVTNSSRSATLAGSNNYERYLRWKELPENIECLVVLGCGLANHIERLLNERTIKHLVIYEPEPQYFQCSVLVSQWSHILQTAHAKGTRIYLQIEKDGRDIVENITELQNTFSHIDGFYLFKHYNNTIFDSVFKALTSTPWSKLKSQGIQYNFTKGFVNQIAPWTPPLDLSDFKDCLKTSKRFQENLEAFRLFFPDIYNEFKDYSPKVWIPVENELSEINLIKLDTLAPLYGDNPRAEGLMNYKGYSEQPHKDGLVLGYEGEKFAHYVHYQFVKEAVKQVHNESGNNETLPYNIEGMIVFGLDVGYQLEHLYKTHTIKNLFICEPNRDFFYASLYAIDWRDLFTKTHNNQSRIYLNIGDDGSNLFNDLLNQFHSIGSYILNSTYFYQSYYNSALNPAIAKLREQLKIVISMGEYFDHSYYGVAHTIEGLRSNIPLLTHNPSGKLTFAEKDVPVFIVGNGPSLDASIDIIKSSKNQAIIISCGTALQAFHRNGIVPDFHAEVEQNRSTYDWAVMIGDTDYLKKITLISCNGVHPDTCSLYKDVMVAFKEGESSTVSMLNLIEKNTFSALEYSYPTVSNFVTDLITEIGFHHIYFIGVDLGFVDLKHHHSKSSGYYNDDGEESFSYGTKNNTSLVVPGNFLPEVNTKYEFKMSCQVIEQAIGRANKEQQYYNCSNGARIKGATPLLLENLLLLSTEEEKNATLTSLRTKVFNTTHNAQLLNHFGSKYSNEQLTDELGKLQTLVAEEITSNEQAYDIIDAQKSLLFESYRSGRSLLFFYLYGTFNFASAVFTKLINTQMERKSKENRFDTTHKLWKTLLKNVEQFVKREQFFFDTSFFNIHEREIRLLERNVRNKRLLVVSDDQDYIHGINWLVENYLNWELTVTSCSFDSTPTFDSVEFVIYNPDHYLDISAMDLINKGTESTLCTLYASYYDKITSLQTASPTVTFLPLIQNENQSGWLIDELSKAFITLQVCAQNHQCQLVLPKYAVQEGFDKERFTQQLYFPSNDKTFFNHPLCITVFTENELHYNALANNGTRGSLITDKLEYTHFVHLEMSKENFEIRKANYKNRISTQREKC